jgi:hypothetical protein
VKIRAILIICITICLITGCASPSLSIASPSVSPSPSITGKEIDKEISTAYVSEGYDAAVKLVRKYYGESKDAKLWLQILDGQEHGKYTENMKISDKSLKQDGKYYYFTATVKNDTGYVVSYFEVNIYLFDSSGKSLDTTYTNWSGHLQPGDSAKVDKMIKFDPAIEKYSTSISDVKI